MVSSALAEGLERCGTVYLGRLLDLDRNGVVTAANVPNTQGNATAVSGNSASRGCGCQRWKQRRGGGIFCQRRFSKEHFADPSDSIQSGVGLNRFTKNVKWVTGRSKAAFEIDCADAALASEHNGPRRSLVAPSDDILISSWHFGTCPHSLGRIAPSLRRVCRLYNGTFGEDRIFFRGVRCRRNRKLVLNSEGHHGGGRLR